jgi:hypothetical protein
MRFAPLIQVRAHTGRYAMLDLVVPIVKRTRQAIEGREAGTTFRQNEGAMV